MVKTESAILKRCAVNTCFPRFSAVMAFLILTAVSCGSSDSPPASARAEGSGPESFDISGFRLGDPGGKALKKAVESRPEGYKCLDVRYEAKDEPGAGGASGRGFDDYLIRDYRLVGYSCFAPKAPSSPYNSFGQDEKKKKKDSEILKNIATSHLLFLFDEGANKIWYIAKRELFKKDELPLEETLCESLEKKYGASSGSCKTMDRSKYSMARIFDRNGDEVAEPFDEFQLGYRPLVSISGIGTMEIHFPLTFPLLVDERAGISLRAAFMIYGESGYALTLYDSRPRFDFQRAVAAKFEAAQAAEEAAEKADLEERKTIVPSF